MVEFLPSQVEMVDVNFLLDNLGTMDLDLTASVSGLPTGAEVTFSDTEVDPDAGNYILSNDDC